MELLDKINADLKLALLAGDKEKVSVLKGLKTALQYAETQGASKAELSGDDMIRVLQKESKKRLEAAELYEQSGNSERANQEKAEKKIIDEYLPQMLSDEEVDKLVDSVIADGNIEPSNQNMGLLIKETRAKVGNQADGAVIARIVKSKIS